MSAQITDQLTVSDMDNNNNINLTDIPTELLAAYVDNRKDLDAWRALGRGVPTTEADEELIADVIGPALLAGLGRDGEVYGRCYGAPFNVGVFNVDEPNVFVFTEDYEWMVAVNVGAHRLAPFSAILVQLTKMPWGEIVPVVAPGLSGTRFSNLDGEGALASRVHDAAQLAQQLSDSARKEEAK